MTFIFITIIFKSGLFQVKIFQFFGEKYSYLKKTDFEMIIYNFLKLYSKIIIINRKKKLSILLQNAQCIQSHVLPNQHLQD
jgi:hypothetical protein